MKRSEMLSSTISKLCVPCGWHKLFKVIFVDCFQYKSLMNTPELDFLRKHPSYAFHAISGFYPLNGELLRKYRDVLFWDDVCENKEIEWSIGLVQTFLKYLKDKKGKLNSIFHYNNRLPWSVEFIKQFETLWYWDILGEIEEIQNNALIQREFQKHLKPVNEWIASLKVRSSNTSAYSTKGVDEFKKELKYWTDEEMELQKSKMDWHELSVGGAITNWNFGLFIKYENYLDFDALICNRNAWVNGFGKLDDSDIEVILADKKLNAELVRSFPKIHLSSVENSHIQIPYCMTYEYFVANSNSNHLV